MEDDVLPDWVKPVAVFFARFLVYAIPFYLVMWLQPDFSLLQAVTARVSGAALHVIGVPVTVDGASLHLDTLLLYVSMDSTAWKTFFVYTALVLAVPGKQWKPRVYGVLSGLLFLFAVNIGRIVSTAYLVEVHGVSYTVLHVFLWRWLLTGALLFTWVAWLYTVKKGELFLAG